MIRTTLRVSTAAVELMASEQKVRDAEGNKKKVSQAVVFEDQLQEILDKLDYARLKYDCWYGLAGNALCGCSSGTCSRRGCLLAGTLSRRTRYMCASARRSAATAG